MSKKKKTYGEPTPEYKGFPVISVLVSEFNWFKLIPTNTLIKLENGKIRIEELLSNSKLSFHKGLLPELVGIPIPKILKESIPSKEYKTIQKSNYPTCYPEPKKPISSKIYNRNGLYNINEKEPTDKKDANSVNKICTFYHFGDAEGQCGLYGSNDITESLFCKDISCEYKEDDLIPSKDKCKVCEFVAFGKIHRDDMICLHESFRPQAPDITKITKCPKESIDVAGSTRQTVRPKEIGILVRQRIINKEGDPIINRKYYDPLLYTVVKKANLKKLINKDTGDDFRFEMEKEYL